MPTHVTGGFCVERKISQPAQLGRWRPAIALVFAAALGCQAQVDGSDPPAVNPSVGGSSSVGGASTGGSGASGGAPAGSGGTGGSQAGAGGSGGASAGTGSGGSTGTVCVPSSEPPRAPLRRITRFEYNNTVRDLLNVTSRPADSLPGEEAGSGFGNDADALGVSRLLVDGYRAIAQQIAKDVTVDTAAVVRVAGCDPATAGEDACQQTFIADFLRRAFRRPAAEADLAAYAQTFATGKTLGGDFASGVRAVVERTLQSAQFLYRVELGEPVDAARNLARPTAYEAASRLSYLLWGSMPDQALFDAAAQGKLNTNEGILDEARRMLADERAKDSLRYFHAQLFGTGGLDHLERDAEYYPTFEPGMGVLFRQETEHFLDDVIWTGAGDLASIFTAPYTFVNEALATFYGIPGVTGDAFQKVNLDTTRRSGLLTQASILTLTTPGSRTDPVIRGKWVFTKILCGTVDDPPSDVPELPDPIPGQSVRDRLALHRSAAECMGCHVLMDPIGFAFENFDGVGLWRDMDNGVPVDASGEIAESDVAGPINGVIELSQRVAQSRDVRNCYAGRFMTFAYGRSITENDSCSRAAIETAFEQTQGNVQELMLAVTQTDGFLLRPLAAPAE